MKKGTILKNQFEFIELLGAGGTGEVWLARRLNHLGEDVAIKVVNKNFSHKDAEKILMQEAEITKCLANHPNIRGISEIIEEDNQYYIIFEYLKGHNLKKFLEMAYSLKVEKLFGNLSIPFCLSVIEEVAKGLEFAHRPDKNGYSVVLHRDIKPENIFITSHGEVLLYDFGISKAKDCIDDASVTTKNFKTVKYSSPELWEDGVYRPEKFSIKHDLYSLGVVLYELLELCNLRS
ncbi:MAG: serine/threonine protein kinase, partial [Bacteriovoracaceae bacterium]|nr:serine/threonine protein kinase [Bacteriovoracaceae bacterium]